MMGRPDMGGKPRKWSAERCVRVCGRCMEGVLKVHKVHKKVCNIAQKVCNVHEGAQKVHKGV